MSKNIIIKANDHKKFSLKQSEYKIIQPLSTRLLLIAPSDSGKSTIIQNLVCSVYDRCFEKIFIISSTIFTDPAYEFIMDYQTNKMKEKHSETNRLYFDTYDDEALIDIIETQKQITMKLKELKKTRLMSILIIIDDMATCRECLRGKALSQIFTSGRHYNISCFVSSQSFTSIAPIIRKNISSLVIFSIKNVKDYENIVEEYSGLINAKTTKEKKSIFGEMYDLATRKKYDFMYIILKENKFYYNFEKEIKYD